jgi:two-component system phosphate regulon sensor histidine kinase PhoR
MGPVDPIVVMAVLALTIGAGAAVLAVVRERRAGVAAAAARDEALTRAERAEQAAARAGAELAELVERVEIGVIRLDDGLVVRVANIAALTALDRGRGRVVGRPAFEAFADQALVDLVTTARDRGAAQAEISPDGPDGRIVAGRANRSADGGLWVTLEDVSDLRRLQRIRTEFIDNLSHELRTPLTSLGLLAETLARDVEAALAVDGPVTPKMQDRLGTIQLETAHLTQMVTEMLELSRIEAGAATAADRLDEIDMVGLAKASIERLRTFADRSSVGLAVETASDGSAAVRGDRDRLGQVLLNLLHNAVKFSPVGSQVAVRVERAGDEVVTSVIDRGIGIPEAAQGRIFERFYKVDRARVRGESGTGLGLAIARHIVDAHGGRIWVESREGTGSAFSFALPALVGERRPEAAASPATS